MDCTISASIASKRDESDSNLGNSNEWWQNATDCTDPLERWLERALSTKRRERRTCKSPYENVERKTAKRRRSASLKTSSSHQHQWREGASAENRPPSAGGPATDLRAPSPYDSLPNIAQASAQGGTPPEKRRRDETSGSRRGRRRGQEHAAVAFAPVGSPAGRNTPNKVATGADERMDAADLAAKKMLLPFMKELSFVEVGLAERGNPSGGGLASSNPVAKDAIALFQSSYLFREGMDSLGKATGTVGRQVSPGRSPRKIDRTEYRSLEGGTVGAQPLSTSASLRAGALSGVTALGKRARDDSRAENMADKTDAGGRQQQQREGKDNRSSSLCPPSRPSRSAEGPPYPVPVGGFDNAQGSSLAAGGVNGGSSGSGDARASSSGTPVSWSKSSHGNPDMASLLRRYPQLCEFMGATLEAIEGIIPKQHPPAKTLRLCEEILDELRKAEELTGAGGARALRNAKRSAAAAEARLAACTTEVDKWCLAQAKDLELREKGERHDNREQRKKRRQRQRRQDQQQSSTAERVGAVPEAASSLRMPAFVATFLTERLGVRSVALQAAVDLLVALETLRPFFPELEHFSLLLRELHDMNALALALHARQVVSRLGGLRLRDVKTRVARPLSRPPLRNEVVVIPHPSHPASTAQAWLTKKGCIVVSFLLLGGGGVGGAPSAKMRVRGILKDARHLTSLARAEWGLDPEQQKDGTTDPPPPPPPPPAPPPRPPPSSLSSSVSLSSSNPAGQATANPESVCTSSGTSGSGGGGGSMDDGRASLSSSGGADRDNNFDGTETGLKRLPISGGSGSGSEDGSEGGDDDLAHKKGPPSKAGCGTGGPPSNATAYVPVHGLLSLLCDLHMKTPDEILDKTKSSDKGGGLGALTTLARAVEQEERREELSLQLVKETKELDVLGAEVLRLERRARSLEESASAGGGSRGSDGISGAKDGLTQARVALALKAAVARRQRDIVQTMRSEVRLADVQVAASWHDVMCPPAAPVPGKVDGKAYAGSTSTTSGLKTTSTVISTSAPSSILTGERPDDDEANRDGRGDAAAVAAAGVGGEMASFEIEAGDGLTEADAADLTSILRKSVVEFGREIHLQRRSSDSRSSSRNSSSSSSRRQSQAAAAIVSSSSNGDGSLDASVTGYGVVREGSSILPPGAPSCSSSLLSQARQDTAAAAVPGASPLDVRPSLAARRVLRTLRMYVTQLRVTKDSESRAEDINWKEELEKRRVVAAVVIQRWARRIRKDMTMIFIAKQKAGALRHIRDRAKRHALAEEERQVHAAGEVLRKQRMRVLQEQEATENILRGAMIRETDQRFWRSRAKRQGPILRAWRMQVRAEDRFRRIQHRQLRGVLVEWCAWLVRHRIEVAAAVEIQQAWAEHLKRCATRETMLEVTARHRRIKAFMVEAIGRNAGDRFASWKRFTSVRKKVKLMRGGQDQRNLERRLESWKAFVGHAKLERHEAAARLQALVRATEAKKRVAGLRRERWARNMISRQISLQIAVLRFRKVKWRMDRLTTKAVAFRKQHDTAFSIRALRAWQVDARGRGGARKKVVAMARRREARLQTAVVSAWSKKTSEIVRQRRHEQLTVEELATRRCSAVTLIQAVWRSHSTRKGFDSKLAEWRAARRIQTRWRGFRVRSTTPTKAEVEHGALSLQRLFRGCRARSRYLPFFLGEAYRAASTGRYERLFWLVGRWPALIQQEAIPAWEGESGAADEDGDGAGAEGEGVLHLACRAGADRCVQLCLQRQADARAVTSAGLTPLHCLALYNTRRGGGGGGGDATDGNIAANGDEDEDGSASQSQQPSTAQSELVVPTPHVETRPAEQTTSLEGEAAPITTALAPTTEAPPPQQQQHHQEQGRTSSTDPSTSKQQQQLLHQYRQKQRKLSTDRSVRIIADMLLDAGAEPDATDADGNTPLLTAAATGGAILCELLLARGAESRATNFFGSSALFLAVSEGNPADNCACVRVLLDAGSDPNESRTDGIVALHLSAQSGHVEVLENLLQHGAQVDAVDLSGMTPLMHAASHDHGGAAGLLCDYGADLDLVDVSGRTALHAASQYGSINALKEILGRSVDMDATDAGKDSALHLAALSGKTEAVQALLESGANPSLQNLQGDNPAHVAAREGHLEIVKALVAYDVRIGQRNWQEYTPFGEARMNNRSEVAEFLSASFFRLGGKSKHKSSLEAGSKTSGGTRSSESEYAELQRGGKAGWDREMEEKAEGWRKEWDEERQMFYYVSEETLEATYVAPFRISADRVEELREGAEVEYLRKVAAVKGESLLGLSDYREAFQDEKADLDAHKLRHEAAILIQSGWRVRLARKRANLLRTEDRSARKIQRLFRRFAARRRHQRWAQLTSACVTMQKSFRGRRVRRRLHEDQAERRRLRSGGVLSRLVSRVYRGHLYGRKPARKLRAQNKAASWGPSQWEAALHDAGEPVRTFYGWAGSWEAYLLQDSVDVMFFRNYDTAEYTWDQPTEWQEQDVYDFYEREHARLYGFTSAEAWAATVLQNAWRGKGARNNFKLLMRAQKICKGAEAAYLADPHSLKCQINYILFTHVIEKDYNRARILYTTALGAMEARGPDVQLLLFAFAIFCLVTAEEDMVSILATVERGIAAGATAATKLAESYTSRRNPKQFALAEAGFFRFAAYNINDSESWHNYAACRQLAYGDYDGASECYLKAIQINPKDSNLQANYQALMDTFPEDSQGSSTFESLASHHKQQAESDKRRQDTASAKFLQRPEVKQAVLKIERAYLRSRQQQIDNFGSYLGPTGMLLRDVQGEVLALQQEQQISAGSSSSNGNRNQQQHQPSTLAQTPPPGSESASPGYLLRTRRSSSFGERPVHEGSTNRSSAGVTDVSGRELALEEPESARKGSGTVLKGSEKTTGASRAHDAAESGPALSSSHRSLGWEIARDDAGNEFYYNGVTGESRWAPPTPDAAVDTSARLGEGDEEQASPGAGGREGGAEAADGTGSAQKGETLKQEAVLPVGWEVVAADDDGAVYYHNVASGLTQWDAPHEVADGEEPKGDTSTPTAPTDGTTGAGWEEFETEEGVPFWYNAASGESCWETPGDRTE